MPNAIGRNSTAMNGSVRTAASSGRRNTMPHTPPDKCCTISSARLPSTTPIQKV